MPVTSIPPSWSGPARYEIIIAGISSAHCLRNWADWFDALAVDPLPGDHARICAELPDQPALHGLIERIRDANLVLVSIQRIEA